MTTHTPAIPAAQSETDAVDAAITRTGNGRWYALALLSVLVALLATIPVRTAAPGFYGVPFFLAAVMLISWYGGFRAGLLATALSVAAMGLFFLPQTDILSLTGGGLWHLSAFSVVALVVHGFSLWRARAEASLRTARSELLEANRVAERYLEAEKEARRAAELSHYRISRVQAVTAALSRAVTPTEVAEAVVNEGVKVLGARAGSIVAFDRQSADAVVLAFTGYSADLMRRNRRIPLSIETPLTEAIRTGQPNFLGSRETFLTRFPNAQLDERSKAWASVPLVQNDMVIGAMGLSFDTEFEFGEPEVEMMAVLANQCAQAFERARLYQAEHQARQAAERLSYRTGRLQAATAALSASTTAAEVAHVVVEEGTSAMGASSGMLLFVTSDGKSLEIAGQRGYPDGLLGRISPFPLEDGTLLASPIASGKSLFYENRDDLTRDFPAMNRTLETTGSEAVAVIPVIAHEQFLGILVMSFREPRRFSLEERELMMAFANQAAQALERARLFEQQKAALTAAEQAEQRYRVLAESIPALVVLADAEGRSFYHNERFLEYTGLKPEDLEGSEWWKTMHPADRRLATRRWLQSFRRGEQTEHEYRMRDHSGEYRWHYGKTIPIKNAEGSVRMWLGFSIDIEDRKRWEQVLAESEERYRTLAESMPALVMVTNADGRIDYVNRRWLDFVGKGLEEIDTIGWETFVHEDDLPSFQARWADCLVTGQVLEHEVRMLRFDGQHRWLSVRAVPMLGPSGKPLRWISVSTDVEQIKRVEERERFLSAATAVLSSSLDYMTILDEMDRLMVPQVADCAAVYVVDGDEARLASRECLHAIEELIPIESPKPRVSLESDDPVAVAVRTGRPQFHTNGVTGHHHHGSSLVVPFNGLGGRLGALALSRTKEHVGEEMDLALVEELAQRLALAVENARLYAESQATQEKLRRANEAKDDFLGLMSHELRTPTTSIYGGIRLLRSRDRQLMPTDREALLQDIETESERLFRMIEDLLVLARLEGMSWMAAEPVRLQHEVPRIVSSFRHKRPGRKVVVHVDTNMAMAASEATYLEQVLRNLLSNADKYSPPGSPIEVEANDVDGRAVVGVLDRGPGVDPEDLSAIFEKFYRSEATSKHVRGIGLGLTVCKRLVEAQAGQIWAESRMGGGLAIKFSLPYYQDEVTE
jgi:PAS domain S-box-containing protein